MTGQDLIDWIHNNKAEDMDVHYFDEYCCDYPAKEVRIEEDRRKRYILLT